ncbi:hypothetical protein EVS84_13385 [Pseudomonas koreensis]|uniref:Uncharacterized protein n=1 Tax=Pseudomonas koreensis TaxID=198620 RepID=A0A4Q4L6J9_9PSED|nr:hypothetical protein EVS84_13385 [Pseudomonas koreensis]
MGASLLAKAVVQATAIFMVPTSSRAGSLSQVLYKFQGQELNRTPGFARSSTLNSNTSGRA